ncbi:hypothetical protein PRUB_a1842 [Pseudoalteromonas rubra]|uniref:Uncharacterized protein n=1 Tax=Pseudoalteromonas rubra TaxID=43658 RepID=A0A8T0CDK5_9GAMM|nr:hypothetical protein PRUB_a1842 [Pseudoalteromonas rubra]
MLYHEEGCKKMALQKRGWIKETPALTCVVEPTRLKSL